MATENDLKYMRMALELSVKGIGKVSPNPMVGAVLVKRGKVVGRGYHRASGSAHAEVNAIKSAGRNARGATMYVTLEPCCHTGKTGPCTEEIIKAGISKVIYASKDPNPFVSGKGARYLKRAGLKVSNGLLKSETQLLNDSYFGYFKNNRPYLIIKAAQTLDGKIATSNGDSKWITSSSALDYAHRLRSQVDAVIVGSGTLRKDNPSLTVRRVKGKNPYRIILSGSLSFSTELNLFSKNYDMKTIIATTSKKTEKKFSSLKHPPIIWNIKEDRNKRLNLKDLLVKANNFGIKSILVEGGAKVITSFINKNLVDKLILITAPRLLGNGISTIGNLNKKMMTDAIEFENQSFLPLGKDIAFIGYPKTRKK